MAKHSTPKRKYTAEFKADVLRLVDNGEPIMAVARKMGISDSLIHAWRKSENKGEEKPINVFSSKSITCVNNSGCAV